MTAAGRVSVPAEPGTALHGMVRDVAAEHLPGRAVRCVVVAMSRDDNPKATVLLFADGEPTPALAVKVALTGEASRAVSAEAVALLRIERLDPARVGDTVPRCLELRHGAGHAALVMTARPGVPLLVGYHRWRHTARPTLVARDFSCAQGWLRRAAQVTLAPAPREEQPDWATLLRHRWPGERVAEQVAMEVGRLSERLWLDGAGGICHGDFWCGNVLRSGEAASGVVDWELATFGGDPLRDRVRFALSYSLYLDRHTARGRPVKGHRGLVAGRWGDGIRYLLGTEGWYPHLVRAFVEDGLAGSGRSPALWRDALLLGLAEIAALSDHDGFGRDHLELFAELAA